MANKYLLYCIILFLFLNMNPCALADALVLKKTDIQVGVLRNSNEAGDRFSRGITEVLSAENHRVNYIISEYEYTTDPDGFDKLEMMLEESKYDIILGPTDSGVYVSAHNHRNNVEEKKVLIISSMVTADIPNQRNGWLFKTNVSVSERAAALSDYLSKHWISSVGVVYANNEFGRRSEKEFRISLQDSRSDVSLPLSYDAYPYDVYPTAIIGNQMERVLESRPEVVAIFGDRTEIDNYIESLKKKNSAVAKYNPWIVTITDTRTNDNFFGSKYIFATLYDSESLTEDEVYYTSKKTAGILDDVINNIDFEDIFDGEKKRAIIRDEFERSIGSLEEEGFRMDGSKNKSPVYLFEMVPDETDTQFSLVKLDEMSHMGIVEKIEFKSRLLIDRFGFLACFNFIILVIIVISVSINDIRRWSDMSWLRILCNRYSLFLVSIHLLLALSVWVYLGENGNFRYDNIMLAIFSASSPSAIAKTTLFQTKGGITIGLSKYYDEITLRIYRKLSEMRYLEVHDKIDTIAVYNSVDAMTEVLEQVYNPLPTEQRVRLTTRMTEELNDAASWMDKRRALARMLFTKFTILQLKERYLIPENFPDDPNPSFRNYFFGSQNNDKFTNPFSIARKVARYCLKDENARFRLEQIIHRRLKKFKKENSLRHDELKRAFEKDLIEVKTTQRGVEKKVQFLLLLKDYDENFFDQEGLTKEGASEKRKRISQICYTNSFEKISSLINCFVLEDKDLGKDEKDEILCKIEVIKNMKDWIERRKSALILFLNYVDCNILYNSELSLGIDLLQGENPDEIIHRVKQNCIDNPEKKKALEVLVSSRVKSLIDNPELAKNIGTDTPQVQDENSDFENYRVKIINERFEYAKSKVDMGFRVEKFICLLFLMEGYSLRLLEENDLISLDKKASVNKEIEPENNI